MDPYAPRATKSSKQKMRMFGFGRQASSIGDSDNEETDDEEGLTKSKIAMTAEPERGRGRGRSRDGNDERDRSRSRSISVTRAMSKLMGLATGGGNKDKKEKKEKEKEKEKEKKKKEKKTKSKKSKNNDNEGSSSNLNASASNLSKAYEPNIEIPDGNDDEDGDGNPMTEEIYQVKLSEGPKKRPTKKKSKRSSTVNDEGSVKSGKSTKSKSKSRRKSKKEVDSDESDDDDGSDDDDDDDESKSMKSGKSNKSLKSSKSARSTKSGKLRKKKKTTKPPVDVIPTEVVMDSDKDADGNINTSNIIDNQLVPQNGQTNMPDPMGDSDNDLMFTPKGAAKPKIGSKKTKRRKSNDDAANSDEDGSEMQSPLSKSKSKRTPKKKSQRVVHSEDEDINSHDSPANFEQVPSTPPQSARSKRRSVAGGSRPKSPGSVSSKKHASVTSARKGRRLIKTSDHKTPSLGTEEDDDIRSNDDSFQGLPLAPLSPDIPKSNKSSKSPKSGRTNKRSTQSSLGSGSPSATLPKTLPIDLAESESAAGKRQDHAAYTEHHAQQTLKTKQNKAAIQSHVKEAAKQRLGRVALIKKTISSNFGSRERIRIPEKELKEKAKKFYDSDSETDEMGAWPEVRKTIRQQADYDIFEFSGHFMAEDDDASADSSDVYTDGEGGVNKDNNEKNLKEKGSFVETHGNSSQDNGNAGNAIGGSNVDVVSLAESQESKPSEIITKQQRQPNFQPASRRASASSSNSGWSNRQSNGALKYMDRQHDPDGTFIVRKDPDDFDTFSAGWNDYGRSERDDATVMSLAETVNVLTSQMDKSRNETQELRKQLSDALAAVARLTEGQRVDQDKIKSVTEELTDLQNIYQGTIERTEQLQADIAKRDELIELKDKRISSLEAAVESQLDKVDFLEEKLEQAEEEVFKMEDEIKRMNEQGVQDHGDFDDSKESGMTIESDVNDESLRDNPRNFDIPRNSIVSIEGGPFDHHNQDSLDVESLYDDSKKETTMVPSNPNERFDELEKWEKELQEKERNMLSMKELDDVREQRLDEWERELAEKEMRATEKLDEALDCKQEIEDQKERLEEERLHLEEDMEAERDRLYKEFDEKKENLLKEIEEERGKLESQREHFDQQLSDAQSKSEETGEKDAEITRMTARILEMDDEIKKLKEQLEQDSKVLDDRNKELEEQKATLAKEKENYETKFAERAKDVEVSNEKAHVHEKELEDEVKKLQEQIEQESEKHKADIEKSQADLAAARDEIDKIKAQFAAKHDEEDKKKQDEERKKKEAEDERLAELTLIESGINAQLRELDLENIELRSQLRELKTKTAGSVGGQERALTAYRKEISELRRINEDLIAENENLKELADPDAADQQRAHIVSLQNLQEEITSQLKELDEENKELIDRIAVDQEDYEFALKEKDETIEDLKDTIEELNRNLSSKDSGAYVSTLLKDMNLLKKENRSLTALKRDLERGKDLVRAKEVAIQKLQDDNEKLEDEVADLKDQKKELEVRLKQRHEPMEDTATVELLEEQLMQLDDELRAKNDELAGYEIKTKGLLQKVRDLESGEIIPKLQAEIKILRNQTESLNLQITSERQEFIKKQKQKDETIQFMQDQMVHMKKGGSAGAAAAAAAVDTISEIDQQRIYDLEEEIEHWKAVNCELEIDIDVLKAEAIRWRKEAGADDEEDGGIDELLSSVRRARNGRNNSSSPVPTKQKKADVPATPTGGGKNPLQGIWSMVSKPLNNVTHNNLSIPYTSNLDD